MSAQAPVPVPAQMRLRWWALALPVVAFVSLFTLLSAGDAQAAGAQPVSQVLAWLQETLFSDAP